MFELDEQQVKRINEWIESLPDAYTGAIGGRLTYQFTPTGLGVVVKVHDQITDTTLDVTDYDSW